MIDKIINLKFVIVLKKNSYPELEGMKVGVIYILPFHFQCQNNCIYCMNNTRELYKSLVVGVFLFWRWICLCFVLNYVLN